MQAAIPCKQSGTWDTMCCVALCMRDTPIGSAQNSAPPPASASRPAAHRTPSWPPPAKAGWQLKCDEWLMWCTAASDCDSIGDGMRCQESTCCTKWYNRYAAEKPLADSTAPARAAAQWQRPPPLPQGQRLPWPVLPPALLERQLAQPVFHKQMGQKGCDEYCMRAAWPSRLIARASADHHMKDGNTYCLQPCCILCYR